MRIVLVENTDPSRFVNKDQMGGYGIGSDFGDSLGTRIISKLKRKGRRIPLLTLGYLAAILKKNGHQVQVYSAEDGPLPETELFLISSSIVECKSEVALARRIREEGRAKVGVVGPFSNYVPEVYGDAVDFIVKGEPEDWASKLTDGNIPDKDVESAEVSDLNSLPFPDWSPFNLDHYGYWPILLQKPFLPILASRGCSFSCNYCPYIVQYPEWRKRSPENVVAEMREDWERYKVRSLLFRDPLFTQGKGRAEAIAEGILSAGLERHIAWACETRTDLLNGKLIDLMVQAGLRGLNVGVESSDLEVLKSANRSQSQPHRERMIRYAESKGVKVATFYVFGLPADTKETVEQTIEYSRYLNTFAAQFHINTPFPGTPIYQMYKDSITDHDWSHYTSFAPVFRHPHLAGEELVALKTKAYESYYFRARYARKHWQQLLPALLSY